MITGEPGVDEARFLALGEWNVAAWELLVKEVLEQGGIACVTLWQTFSALEVPLFAPPSPPQGPSPPPSPPHRNPSPPPSPPHRIPPPRIPPPVCNDLNP